MRASKREYNMLKQSKSIFRPALSANCGSKAAELVSSLDDSKEGIRKFLERNPDTCFVTENASEMIDMILCSHDGRRSSIYQLASKQSIEEKG
jgi:hypothetical protein